MNFGIWMSASFCFITYNFNFRSYSLFDSGIGKLRAPFMNNVNSKFLQSTLLNMKKSIDPNNIFGAQNGCFVRGRD